MPVANPVMVVLLPLPVIPPGLIVQLPAGRPLSTTLPVAVVQVGWVMVPTIGAVGGVLLAVIEMLAVAVQPFDPVTVTV